MIQPPARKRRLTITDKSKFKILNIYDRLVDYLREKQPMLHMAGQFFSLGSSHDQASTCKDVLGFRYSRSARDTAILQRASCDL